MTKNQETPVRQESLVIAVPQKKIINANQALHHRAKAARVKHLRALSRSLGIKHQEQVISSGCEFPKFDTYKVKFVVYQPQRRWMDPPNFSPTSKAFIDGLTDAGWWDDDNLEKSLETTFVYGGLSGLKGHYIFELIIFDVTNPEQYVTTRGHETNILERVDNSVNPNI